MKKFNDILEEIRDTNSRIKATEAEGSNLVNKYVVIEDIPARYDKKRELEGAIAENENAATRLKMTREILKSNARIALFNEVLPVAIEVLSKYKGKPYGEKTREKICAEVHARTGCRFYISRRYGSGTYELYPDAGYSNDYNVTCTPEYKDGQQPALLIDNKINVLPFDGFVMCYVSRDYVEDIPARIEAVIRLYNAASAMQTQLRDICSEYNALAVGNLPQIYAEQRIYPKFHI